MKDTEQLAAEREDKEGERQNHYQDLHWREPNYQGYSF